MTIEQRLSGGHPNSLGHTIEVVEDVLENPKLFDELFNCYFSKDEVVRLRVSNAMKRINRTERSLLIPYIDRFLNEISKIDQASAQWTLAELFLALRENMTDEQIIQAERILKTNLSNHHDWIVLNETMRTLGIWAQDDIELRAWLEPQLVRLSVEPRKSISNRAKKLLKTL